MSSSNDEINLLDAFRRLFSFIRKTTSSVATYFLRNIFFITSFSLLGTAGGYIKFITTTPLYESEMVASSNYLQNDFCVELINNLQDYIDDKTPLLLAKKLGIDEASVKKIHYIEYSNFNDKIERLYKYKDTVVLGMPFRIKLITTDNSILGTVEEALIKYFDNNPFIAVEKQLQQESTRAIIGKLQSDITQLDSLKKSVENNLAPRGTQSGFVFGQPIDPVNIYREGIKLYREELSLTSHLKVNVNNIRVYTHFEAREKPYRPKLALDLTLGAIVGAILGVLSAAIRAIFRKK